MRQRGPGVVVSFKWETPTRQPWHKAVFTLNCMQAAPPNYLSSNRRSSLDLDQRYLPRAKNSYKRLRDFSTPSSTNEFAVRRQTCFNALDGTTTEQRQTPRGRGRGRPVRGPASWRFCNSVAVYRIVLIDWQEPASVTVITLHSAF